jgi:septal ring factor EnvC (AmiA/AmiB activator)
MRKELNDTRKELEALRQQNAVLERDIHTCNFERVSLTKTLQQTKETYEKLGVEIQAKELEREKNKKASLPPLHLGESHAEILVNRPQCERQTIPTGNSGSSELGTSKVPQKEPETGRKKKANFVYVNGRLERQFKIKK